MLRTFRRTVATRPSGLLRGTPSRGIHSISPVELEFDKYIPPTKNEKDEPLVILHGFLGSKRNWQSLCKALVRDLNRPVYALDLRNHGASPHAAPHNYPALAADVLHFLSEKGLENPTVLGHSMGGKVAMTIALSDEGRDRLGKLVVEDIAPTAGVMSDEFVSYARAMREVEAKKVKTRKEASEVVRTVESDPSVLAFLLTNITTAPDGTIKFRLPLDILEEFIPDIGLFPYAPGERKWEKPTLFVKGERSKFLNRHNIPAAQTFFPNMQLERLDSGHWVHAERPNEFKKLLIDFVGRAD